MDIWLIFYKIRHVDSDNYVIILIIVNLNSDVLPIVR